MDAIADTLNYKLADNPPAKCYAPLKLNGSKLFAGYIIKNEYDEQRIEISRKLNPARFSFLTNTGDYKLYGILKDSDAFFLQKLEEKKKNSLIWLSIVAFLHWKA